LPALPFHCLDVASQTLSILVLPGFQAEYLRLVRTEMTQEDSIMKKSRKNGTKLIRGLPWYAIALRSSDRLQSTQKANVIKIFYGVIYAKSVEGSVKLFRFRSTYLSIMSKDCIMAAPQEFRSIG
jgi:hypothetical protein